MSVDVEAPDIPDYVVVELRYESPVAYSRAQVRPLRPPPRRQAETLNNVLAKYDIETMRSHFGLAGSPAIKARVEVAATLPPEPEPKKFAKKGMDTEFIQSGFVQVVPKKSSDAAKIARELNQKGAVWKAYVAPRPVPAAVAERIAGAAAATSSRRRAICTRRRMASARSRCGRSAERRARAITICDIEGNWNRTHEDLPSGISLIGGTVIDDLGWRNHGTAVLGEMISIPDVRGTVGISHARKGGRPLRRRQRRVQHGRRDHQRGQPA